MMPERSRETGQTPPEDRFNCSERCSDEMEHSGKVLEERTCTQSRLMDTGRYQPSPAQAQTFQ